MWALPNDVATKAAKVLRPHYRYGIIHIGGDYMKKHRCPWCGEKTLSTFQKTSRRTHDTGAHKVKNRIYFSCSSCGKQIDHILTPKGKKYENILMICILVFSLFFFVFTALQIKPLMLMAVAMIAVSAILLILVYGKFTEFIKKEDEVN